MLKVEITKAWAKGRAVWRAEATGSVRLGGRRAELARFETLIRVESPAPPEQVAHVIRVAKNGCFARQALSKPVPIDETVELNGQPFDWESFDVPSTW